MAGTSYYYLVSSLPLLRLEEPPPFPSSEFLDTCRGQLSATRFAKLAQVTLLPRARACCEVERQWNEWETGLRNCLVRHRAAALGLDPERLFRPTSEVWPQLDRQVDEAMNGRDPGQRELALDRLRWQHLTDLEPGHDFDFETLVIYRLKLLLVEKRSARTVERGERNMEALLGRVLEDAHAHRAPDAAGAP
ncbi:MAG: DUF2764 family protein [Kiritimatiellaeota bacterium]|nr:DUF2764 family protein [Kiritimatiellota bacterium]